MIAYLAHWVLLIVAAAVAVRFVRRARRDPTRGRLIVGNLLVGVALCVAAVVAGETYLRFLFDSTTWQVETLATRAWLERHQRLNEMGFRDVEFALEKRPRVHRIAFIGDSFTYGFGIDDPADRFSDRVRAHLEGRAPGRFEVWNVATIGADTSRARVTLTGLLERGRVDRVVLVYSPNDAEDLLPQSSREVTTVRRPESGVLRRHSFLLDLAAGRWELASSDAGERYFDGLVAFYEDDAAWARQRDRLTELADLCRTAGVRFQIAVFPLVSHWGEEYPFDAAHERVIATFRDSGVEVLDLRPAFAGRVGTDLVVNVFDPHPNELAHAIAGDAMIAELFED